MAQKRRQPEIIAGRVNADGSIAAGDGFTASLTSTGIFALTFPSTFRLIGVTASSMGGDRVIDVVAVTGNTAQINSYVGNTAALDSQPFLFVAVGVQQ